METSNIILMFDGFGLALFSAAFYFGMVNYRKFEHSRVLWALFNIAMAMGAAMSLFVGLEWLGVVPEIADPIEGSLTLVFTVMLFVFILVEKEENKLAAINISKKKSGKK